MPKMLASASNWAYIAISNEKTTMNLSNYKRSSRGKRNQKGLTLIEILVALLLGALLAGVFLDILGQLMRLGSATQNEISANAIAQEMIENSHALGYNYLSQQTGTYTLSLQPANIHPQPIQLDLTNGNKQWSPASIKSNFSGKAVYTVATSPTAANAIDVSVTVSWTDGQNPTKRPISMSTTLTQSGLDKWNR
jgi:prepilin-type N-terminal cleavage/methylation domain-containing protein